MTIEQTDVVDFVTIDKATGAALLTISDHMPWSQGEGDHLTLLQTKVYRYLDGVESGELVQRFPKIEGKPIVISIQSLHALSPNGQKLVDNLRQYLAETGIELRWTLFTPNPAASD